MESDSEPFGCCSSYYIDVGCMCGYVPVSQVGVFFSCFLFSGLTKLYVIFQLGAIGI